MSDPTEDVPRDHFLGQGDGDFELGALGLGVAEACGIGGAVQLADQLHGTGEGMNATVTVGANVHHASAGRTITLQDPEFPKSQIGVDGPSARHPTNILAVPRSLSWADQSRSYARESRHPSAVADRCFFPFIDHRPDLRIPVAGFAHLALSSVSQGQDEPIAGDHTTPDLSTLLDRPDRRVRVA